MEEDDERCFKVTKKLLTKCKELILFNVETMNDKQIVLSKTEFAKVSKILGRLLFIRDLPIEVGNHLCEQAAGKSGTPIDIRIQHKAWKVKMELINEVYGKADFNYQLFNSALKEFMADEKKKKEKQKPEKDERSEHTIDSGLKVRSFGMSPAENCLCYIAAFVLVVVIFLVTFRFMTGTHVSLYNFGMAQRSTPSNY